MRNVLFVSDVRHRKHFRPELLCFEIPWVTDQRCGDLIKARASARPVQRGGTLTNKIVGAHDTAFEVFRVSDADLCAYYTTFDHTFFMPNGSAIDVVMFVTFFIARDRRRNISHGTFHAASGRDARLIDKAVESTFQDLERRRRFAKLTADENSAQDRISEALNTATRRAYQLNEYLEGAASTEDGFEDIVVLNRPLGRV